MSDRRAIALVTFALRNMLQEVANEAVGGAAVTVKRPDARDDAHKDQPGLNLFLYRVSTNPSLRNNELPTRDREQRVVQRPMIALNLDFLITAYGAGLQPHLLLGAALSRLHARPLLVRPDEALAGGESLSGLNELRNPEAARLLERVVLAPVPLSLEELSKLWSVFLLVPYDLSVAVQASPVVIEAEEDLFEVPEVKERAVGVDST